MSIDPPYRFDPLQNVVNVKWTDDAFGLDWNFATHFTHSEVLDCPIGPNITLSTTSMTLTAQPFTPPSGFTVSGAPSASGSIPASAGTWASLLFTPSTKRGTGPGSTTFQVVGLLCGTTVGSTIPAGSFGVSVPAITVTNIDTSQVYTMVEWSATAVAGITVAVAFRPAA